jgi:hypothetical protein
MKTKIDTPNPDPILDEIVNGANVFELDDTYAIECACLIDMRGCSYVDLQTAVEKAFKAGVYWERKNAKLKAKAK